jgi:hypothetical protein
VTRRERKRFRLGQRENEKERDRGRERKRDKERGIFVIFLFLVLNFVAAFFDLNFASRQILIFFSLPFKRNRIFAARISIFGTVTLTITTLSLMVLLRHLA